MVDVKVGILYNLSQWTELQVSRIPSGRRSTNIMTIQDGHREVLRLLALGYKNKDVSAITGFNVSHISTIRHSAISRPYLDGLQNKMDNEVIKVTQAEARIKQLVEPALKVLQGILNDGVPSQVGAKTQLTAAFGILDRAGHAPVQRSQNVSLTGHFDAKDIEEMKSRVELAKRQSVVVDVDAKVTVCEDPTNQAMSS